jgi:hypothetical protein
MDPHRPPSIQLCDEYQIAVSIDLAEFAGENVDRLILANSNYNAFNPSIAAGRPISVY